MEEIYENLDQLKSANLKASTSHTGPTSSEKSSYSGFTIFLGLLSVFLLVGLIILGVLYGYSAAELSDVKDNVGLLQTSTDKLSSVTEERDLLNANLTKMTEERDLLKANLTKMIKEMERLQNFPKQKKTCREGWKMLSCTCHFLSEASGSWDEGRQDCRNRGADLVVIDSPEEQTFLSDFTKRPTWIGLNDRDHEGIWKWVDGTPLTLKYWDTNQPDNGGGVPKYGEEDCVHIRTDDNTAWNDISCASSLPWVCEKIP
ncbi:CD209 antigen-like protein C [Mugil cephalus]|uniref:CD209 antigen-like protein C n=1 Tax=Mugil cephalus TaxID=48193 RepID=UPI001FB7CD77|nr:CD209 antigen-like protein C [Mugil cephalus]